MDIFYLQLSLHLSLFEHVTDNCVSLVKPATSIFATQHPIYQHRRPFTSGCKFKGPQRGALSANSIRCSGSSDHYMAHVQANYMLEAVLGLEFKGRVECSSRLWEGSQKWMLERGPEVDAQARSGYSSQKWMLEPEVDVPREQGLNDRTNDEC